MANKSEKRRIEQAFIFIQLRFVIKYAVDFKEESTKIEKLKTVDVAGYSKKLEKLGFLDIGHFSNSSERVVSLTSSRDHWKKDKVEQ